MNQEAINLTKVAIKHYEDEKLKLTAEILRSRIKIEQAEKDISRIDNIKHSLGAALEKLEEADEKEGRERDPTKKEMGFIKKQDLLDTPEDPREPKEEDQPASETVEISHPTDIPEEAILTDEEIDEATLEKADKLIKREKEKLKVEKKDWKKCRICNRRPVAPWNRKGICSTCQKRRKTNRPYKRKNVVI